MQSGPAGDARVIVIGATNRPADLDDGVLRRLERRVYVPLPDEATRAALLSITLRADDVAKAAEDLTDNDFASIARATQGYSGSDVANLCKEAAMRPVREVTVEELRSMACTALRKMRRADFDSAMNVVTTSVEPDALKQYEAWNAKFGMKMSHLA